jgi:hypothetical protein
MFLVATPFVGFSGYAFTWQWFTRLDDFYAGVPGPVAPSSALHVELRQRQLLTVLSRNAPRGSQNTMGTPRGSGVGDQDGTGPGERQPPQLDLSIIDAMYEQAMAGPVCGPLLRLFLAEYIRYGENHGRHVVGVTVVAKPSCICQWLLQLADAHPTMLYTKVFVRVVHNVCPCYPRAGCRVYVRNRHLEAVQLRVLEKMPMPFDVALFVFMRQRELKAADRAERPEGGEMPMLVLFVCYPPFASCQTFVLMIRRRVLLACRHIGRAARQNRAAACQR